MSPNAADRTGPSMEVLEDSQLNASPQFPHHVCPNNGYFVAGVFTQNGDKITFLREFSVPLGYADIDTGDPADEHVRCYQLLAWMTSPETLLINVGGITLHGSGWAVDPTDGFTFPAGCGFHQEGHLYSFEVEAVDANTIKLTVSDGVTGEAIDNDTLTVTDIFSSYPVTLYAGWPPDAILERSESSYPYNVTASNPYGTRIISVS